MLEQVTCKFVPFGEAMHTKKTGKLVYRERMKDTASGQERIKQEPCNTRKRSSRKALSSGVPGPNEAELHSLALGPGRCPVILQLPSFGFQLKCFEISFHYSQPKIIH